MMPTRSVLNSWRALSALDQAYLEFGRRAADLEVGAVSVREACHRLGGQGWREAGYETVVSRIELLHRDHRRLCEQSALLRETATRTLHDLHSTVSALLDYVADAETAGCQVADDWTVTAEQPGLADEWAEVIAEAVTAVHRADERGSAAVRTVGAALAASASTFDTCGPADASVPVAAAVTPRSARVPGAPLAEGTGGESGPDHDDFTTAPRLPVAVAHPATGSRHPAIGSLSVEDARPHHERSDQEADNREPTQPRKTRKSEVRR